MSVPLFCGFGFEGKSSIRGRGEVQGGKGVTPVSFLHQSTSGLDVLSYKCLVSVYDTPFPPPYVPPNPTRLRSFFPVDGRRLGDHDRLPSGSRVRRTGV